MVIINKNTFSFKIYMFKFLETLIQLIILKKEDQWMHYITYKFILKVYFNNKKGFI